MAPPADYLIDNLLNAMAQKAKYRETSNRNSTKQLKNQYFVTTSKQDDMIEELARFIAMGKKLDRN